MADRACPLNCDHLKQQGARPASKSPSSSSSASSESVSACYPDVIHHGSKTCKKIGFDKSRKLPQYGCHTGSGTRMVFTDGSYANWPTERAGAGVWFGENNPHNQSFRCTTEPDCNRAEVDASLSAIEQSKQHYPGEKLKVFTDSKFTINLAATKKKEDAPNGFSGDYKKMNKALNEFGGEVIFVKVAAHNSRKGHLTDAQKFDFISTGNRQADKLAREGRGKEKKYSPYE